MELCRSPYAVCGSSACDVEVWFSDVELGVASRGVWRNIVPNDDYTDIIGNNEDECKFKLKTYNKIDMTQGRTKRQENLKEYEEKEETHWEHGDDCSSTRSIRQTMIKRSG
uniref:Uncharacterized protein n=1 Tax=Tanacetum cinerariifolium TaxID=118510 RepID=A0A6L2NCG6_TANCI|nr:hypothetical protein [Tanacetum cinerariifolium]